MSRRERSAKQSMKGDSVTKGEKMNRRLLLIVLLALMVGVSAALVACGDESTETTATTAGGTETTATNGAATGEPIKFGFNEGFTEFMAYDCELADKGVKDALDMLGNQWNGRPLEYYPGGQRLQSRDRGAEGREAGRERQDQRHDRPDLLAIGEGSRPTTSASRRASRRSRSWVSRRRTWRPPTGLPSSTPGSSTRTGTTSGSTLRRRASRPPMSSTMTTHPPMP